MPLDIQRPDLTLGVVGTGIMGRGIAQIAAQAGIRTVLYDTPARRRAGGAGVHRNHAREARGTRPDPGGRRTRATGLIEIAHVLTHLSACHVVVEAIVEDLQVKRELFRGISKAY